MFAPAPNKRVFDLGKVIEVVQGEVRYGFGSGLWTFDLRLLVRS